MLGEALRPLGLSHVQFVLLACAWWLARDGNNPTQREIADQAGTDPMMTSQVLRSLEGRGLIERAADETDGRVRRVQPSPRGRKLARRAIEVVERADEQFFGSVDIDRTLPVLATLAKAPTDEARSAA